MIVFVGIIPIIRIYNAILFSCRLPDSQPQIIKSKQFDGFRSVAHSFSLSLDHVINNSNHIQLAIYHKFTEQFPCNLLLSASKCDSSSPDPLSHAPTPSAINRSNNGNTACGTYQHHITWLIVMLDEYAISILILLLAHCGCNAMPEPVRDDVVI